MPFTAIFRKRKRFHKIYNFPDFFAPKLNLDVTKIFVKKKLNLKKKIIFIEIPSKVVIKMNRALLCKKALTPANTEIFG